MARGATRTEADIEKLIGWKCLKGVGELLAHLRGPHDCPNRKLHYDEYATLLLFYFFNATLTSLRSLRRLTDFDKVRRKLGIWRSSLGSPLGGVAGLRPRYGTNRCAEPDLRARAAGQDIRRPGRQGRRERRGAATEGLPG